MRKAQWCRTIVAFVMALMSLALFQGTTRAQPIAPDPAMMTASAITYPPLPAGIVRLPFAGTSTISQGPQIRCFTTPLGITISHCKGAASPLNRQAIDFALNPGTPLLSVMEGQIFAAGRGGALDGNYVFITNNSGTVRAFYDHLRDINGDGGTPVKAGQTVHPGTLIGHSGAPPDAPDQFHLHFAVVTAPFINSNPFYSGTQADIRGLPGISWFDSAANTPANQYPLIQWSADGYILNTLARDGKNDGVANGRPAPQPPPDPGPAPCQGGAHPVLTQSLSGSPNPAAVGQPVQVTTVIRNDGCAPFKGLVLAGGRGPGGANDVEDFPGSLVTINKGDIFSYAATRFFSTPGAYGFDMGYKDAAGNWFPIYGVDGSVSRHWDLTVQQPLAHLNLVTIPGGSVTLSPPGGTYPVGTVVTLTATPAAGYTFTGWFIDNTIPSMDNPYRLTMDGDHSVQATFGVAPGGTSLGGSVTLAPAAASFKGRLYVFATHPDNTLWMRSSVDTITWTDWTQFADVVTMPPAAVSFNGRLYIFVTGTDNALYKDSTADGVTWTGWINLGDSLSSGPSAATANGVLSVFARGSDGSLDTIRSTDGVAFGAWQNLSGPYGAVGAAPPAAVGFHNLIYVFALGTDNSLWERHSADGATFTDWTDYGGIFFSTPAVTSVMAADGTERLYMFTIDMGGTLYVRSATYADNPYGGPTGNWTGWTSLGGQFFAPGVSPAAASFNGTVYAFGRWSDSTLQVVALQP